MPNREFREALARWAASVTLVAVRDPDDGAVHATTVTSFAPVAAEPPLVVVSLGPTAQALPFVDVGRTLGVSILAEHQARLATMYADSYPVGAAPWPREGPPIVPDALVTLVCEVREIHGTEGRSRLLVCRVDSATRREDERPLLYWNRAYHRLSHPERE
jgi:flavin reductase (DIM6/NTAB) family NADH-FMN oxidoreductase RutF